MLPKTILTLSACALILIDHPNLCYELGSENQDKSNIPPNDAKLMQVYMFGGSFMYDGFMYRRKASELESRETVGANLLDNVDDSTEEYVQRGL